MAIFRKAARERALRPGELRRALFEEGADAFVEIAARLGQDELVAVDGGGGAAERMGVGVDRFLDHAHLGRRQFGGAFGHPARGGEHPAVLRDLVGQAPVERAFGAEPFGQDQQALGTLAGPTSATVRGTAPQLMLMPRSISGV